VPDEQLEPTAPEAPETTEETPVDPTPATPSTSSESSESTSGETPAAPVVVTNLTARDDNDARLNTFVDVVDGEHKGRVGAYVETVEHDLKGYPLYVLVRTRDEFNHLIQVAYKHVRPSRFTGGR